MFVVPDFGGVINGFVAGLYCRPIVWRGRVLAFFPHTFDFFLGFSLLTYAVNCFVFLMGGAQIKSSPILGENTLADPLPQALVLTAIVIGLASTIIFGFYGHLVSPFQRRPTGSP